MVADPKREDRETRKDKVVWGKRNAGKKGFGMRVDRAQERSWVRSDLQIIRKLGGLFLWDPGVDCEAAVGGR